MTRTRAGLNEIFEKFVDVVKKSGLGEKHGEKTMFMPTLRPESKLTKGPHPD